MYTYIRHIYIYMCVEMLLGGALLGSEVLTFGTTNTFPHRFVFVRLINACSASICSLSPLKLQNLKKYFLHTITRHTQKVWVVANF